MSNRVLVSGGKLAEESKRSRRDILLHLSEMGLLVGDISELVEADVIE